jgi:hypothetical protein
MFPVRQGTIWPFILMYMSNHRNKLLPHGRDVLVWYKATNMVLVMDRTNNGPWSWSSCRVESKNNHLLDRDEEAPFKNGGSLNSTQHIWWSYVCIGHGLHQYAVISFIIYSST